jgi:hypothetical protein
MDTVHDCRPNMNTSICAAIFNRPRGVDFSVGERLEWAVLMLLEQLGDMGLLDPVANPRK